MEQLRRVDRLKSVGTLAAGVAHELGTPLNVVAGRASMIANDRSCSPGSAESARIIKAQADRMASIIRQLLGFSRTRPPIRRHQDLVRVAGEIASLVEPLARKRGVGVEVDPSPEEDIRVEADVGVSQIQQVLTNLMMNAIQASPAGTRVRIGIARAAEAPPTEPHGSPRPGARPTVRDAGKGIDPDALPRIFEPFFTTKDAGEGTGLGLSIVHGIVSEHGGWVGVESTPGEGSVFTVFLPDAQPEEARPAADVAPSPPAGPG